MSAETLNCPMCGAAAATGNSKCAHCGARLATVSCPSCFGMLFEGAKFCSHCGSHVSRGSAPDETPLPCPRCKTDMQAARIGDTWLRECPRCEGLWMDKASVEYICANREQQSAVLGAASVVPQIHNRPLETVRYVPCPECGDLMHRVNFARCSSVVVDVCKAHGTWFDKDELRLIVEFIRAGGMERARVVEMEELRQQRARLASERNRDTKDFGHREWPSRGGAGMEILLDVAVKALRVLD